MHPKLAALAAACAGAVWLGSTQAENPPVARAQEAPPAASAAAPAATTAAVPTPTVVARQYVRPKRARILSTRFEPWSRPSPAQVRTIIAVEAARAGVQASALARRISCESGFRWWASNGQYDGLGQFASETFYRGMTSIGTRRVRLVTRRARVKRVRRVDTLSDGTVRATWRWPVQQRVVHVYRGTIPKTPPKTHGWAQVRIMAQALAGRSAVSNSEWDCSA